MVNGRYCFVEQHRGRKMLLCRAGKQRLTVMLLPIVKALNYYVNKGLCRSRRSTSCAVAAHKHMLWTLGLMWCFLEEDLVERLHRD